MVGRFIGSIGHPLEWLGMVLKHSSMLFLFAGLLSAVFFCSFFRFEDTLIRHFLLIVGIVSHAE